MEKRFHIRLKAALLTFFLLVAPVSGIMVLPAKEGSAWRGMIAPAIAESANPAAATVAAVASSPAPTGEPALSGEEDDAVELTDAEMASDDATLAEIEANATLDVQAKLAEVFKRYKTIGAVVCVVENGQVTHTFTYGTLDQEGTPIEENTLFRVGSISKMVTAMGVMRLVEQGKLLLDGDLSDVLGFAVRNAQYPNTPITLRQLMSHTTGLRDSSYYTMAIEGTVMPLDSLFAGNDNPSLFIKNVEAGTASNYSNFGGGLLGSLIERVTGETVDAYMAETIFAPLGITAAYQSALLPAKATVSNIYTVPSRAAATHVRDGQPAKTVAKPQTDYLLTAGKLTISAPDLAKLVIALCDGGVAGDTRVLSENSVAQMLTAQNFEGSVVCESNRGLCMNILKDTGVEGRTLYGHGGKANGMLCAAYFDPTDRTGVVMLTNGCNNRPMHNDVGMLSLAVIRLCYATLIDGLHVTQDPWLVAQ